MTEADKAKIISLWENGMTLGQIRQMIAVSPREFDLTVRSMKKGGEFPKIRKTAEEKVVEAFKGGETNPYVLADTYGVKVSSVKLFLHWNGCKRKRPPLNYVHCDRTNAIIEDLREGEISQIEIAKKHGVSRQYVTKIKRKLERAGADNEQ
jgi:transposase